MPSNKRTKSKKTLAALIAKNTSDCDSQKHCDSNAKDDDNLKQYNLVIATLRIVRALSSLLLVLALSTLPHVFLVITGILLHVLLVISTLLHIFLVIAGILLHVLLVIAVIATLPH